jgi:hypothetical protein
MTDLIPGWFFGMKYQSLSFGWIGVWLVMLFTLLWVLPNRSEKEKVGMLFCTAFLSPIFLSLAGEQPLLEHCFASGHAEFVITGSRGLSWMDVFREYETFVLSDSQRYAASKPPGQLLLYIFLYNLIPTMSLDVPSDFIDAAHFHLSLWLIFVMPLLSAMVVFPFYALLKRYFSPKEAWVPVLLFVLSPSFSLIVMHLDQVLYPLVGISVVLCARISDSKDNALWALFGGVLFGVGTTISFSILPILLLLFLVLPFRISSLGVLKWGILGALLWYCMLYVGWGYNPIIRYQHAMIHHAEWKGFPWTWGNWWIATRVNILEFLLWMGPLVVLFISGIQKQYKDQCIYLLLFGGLLFFGKAAGEVARLWLFLMPFFWMTSCRTIKHEDVRFYAVIMALWTVLIKILMDF